MTDEKFPNERLWLVNTIADILVDLVQDVEDPDDDPDEVLEQMLNVAELLIEGLNVEITGSDGERCTLTLGVTK
jgi:hypothetical protein